MEEKEMVKINLENAVMEKGTAGMIKQFNQKKEASKKKKGTINSNYTNILIESYECDWETVLISGSGANRDITCIGRKETSNIREDKRISNGTWKIPYTKNLDIIVVSHLENLNIAVGEQTLNKWCLDFGLINESTYQLVKSKNNLKAKDSHIEKLKEKKIINNGQERIINDYIDYVKELQKQLAGTLERMKKINIINFTEKIVGVNEEGQKVELDGITIDRLQRKNRELKEVYQVDTWTINTLTNKKNVKEFNEEWRNFLHTITNVAGEPLELDFYYTAYIINLKATKKKIIKYLGKYNNEVIEVFKDNPEQFVINNKNDFQQKRNVFVYDRAYKKEQNFLDGKSYKKQNEELLEEFGGKEKKVFIPQPENFTFDEEYYQLYFQYLYATKIKDLQEYYNHTF